MKTILTVHKPDQTGSALMLTMIMSAIALALLAGAMSWSASNTRLTYRSIQYNQSVAAAEAATEKVVSQINRDFLYGGESWSSKAWTPIARTRRPRHRTPHTGAHGSLTTLTGIVARLMCSACLEPATLWWTRLTPA